MWVPRCVLKAPYCEKLLSQFVHLNGFSPVWVLSCAFRLPSSSSVKLLSQYVHLNGFWPVWVLSCDFRLFGEVKLFSHVVHLKSFCDGRLILSGWLTLLNWPSLCFQTLFVSWCSSILACTTPNYLLSHILCIASLCMHYAFIDELFMARNFFAGTFKIYNPMLFFPSFCNRNQSTQQLLWDMSLFLEELSQYKLVLKLSFRSDTFVMEYVGEVLDMPRFRKRAKKYSKDDAQHFYFMALTSELFIDASHKGSVSRFINHSCDPNAETQKVHNEAATLFVIPNTDFVPLYYSGQFCLSNLYVKKTDVFLCITVDSERGIACGVLFQARDPQRGRNHLRLQVRAIRSGRSKVLLRVTQLQVIWTITYWLKASSTQNLSSFCPVDLENSPKK